MTVATRTGEPLLEKELSEKVLEGFFDVYSTLGDGFLEAVYANAMLKRLHAAGLAVEREATVKVYYRGQCVGHYRADLLVEEKILLELKALPQIGARERAQILNYLKASEIQVGFILNFGPRPHFQRFIHTRKEHLRVPPE